MRTFAFCLTISLTLVTIGLVDASKKEASKEESCIIEYERPEGKVMKCGASIYFQPTGE